MVTIVEAIDNIKSQLDLQDQTTRLSVDLITTRLFQLDSAAFALRLADLVADSRYSAAKKEADYFCTHWQRICSLSGYTSTSIEHKSHEQFKDFLEKVFPEIENNSFVPEAIVKVATRFSKKMATFGHGEPCFGHTKTCQYCQRKFPDTFGDGWQEEFICLCGYVRPFCGLQSLPNGRCKWHGGRHNAQSAEGRTLTAIRRRSATSAAAQQMLEIHQSPDLLRNTADIVVIEARQNDLQGMLGDISPQHTAKLLKSDMARICRLAEKGDSMGVAEIINRIASDAGHERQIYSEIKENAVLLAGLREGEFKALKTVATIITLEEHLMAMREIRNKVRESVRDGAQAAAQLLLEKGLSNADQISSLVDREVRKAITANIKDGIG